MRYLYQQLLAFWVLIVIIIMVIGVSFSQLTRRTLEEVNYDQLEGYAQSVESNWRFVSQDYLLQGIATQLFKAVAASAATLNPQRIDFALWSFDGKQVYPSEDNSDLTFELSEEDWDQIKSAKRVTKTLPTDLYGNKETTSYLVSPFDVGGQLYGALVISQPSKNIDESYSGITSNLVVGFIVSAVIAVVISYLFAQFQMKKINSMKKAAREIANGNFDIQIVEKNRDEFDELAHDFNKMAVSLKQSSEEINLQEERRKQFMADASHEMRTPLTTIKGLLEGLKYNAIPENQKENAINLMENETERLIRLVNENLDYEKIRSNQVSIVIKRFSATEALQNIITQLSEKAESVNDKLTLVTAEDVEVYADYDRFVQIMVNIIQNAIQFTKDGEISIVVEKLAGKTCISISDTGIGISEEKLSNIWERYYKVDPSRKNNKYGESGLGLSIVQQLVKLHNAAIEVDSTEGRGTTFTVAFPDTEAGDDCSE